MEVIVDDSILEAFMASRLEQLANISSILFNEIGRQCQVIFWQTTSFSGKPLKNLAKLASAADYGVEKSF